jgi:hypothetical protein
VAHSVESKKRGEEVKVMTLDAATMQRIAGASSDEAELMRLHPTDVTVVPLPFYRKNKWVQVVISLPTHPIAFDHVDDGTHAAFLGGTPESIYVVNRAERLRLSDDQVIPYVVFFLTVTGDKGSKLVVEPSDVPWLPTTEQDEALKARRQAVSKKVHPVQVSKVADGYRVSIQVVLMQQLIELSLAVAHDGLVRTIETRTLDEDLPVHYYE